MPQTFPKTVSGFEIVSFLGKGAMGQVFKAQQKSLGRFIALKILAPELAANPEYVTRFDREARAAAALSHTNVVGVIDTGIDEASKLRFIAFEFVEGVNLEDVIKAKGRLPEREALKMVRDVCKALQHGHEKGLVHRDVKPANVLLSTDKTLKLADFGLARQAREDSSVTNFGEIIGTPHYMSPEQAMGEKVDIRSDLSSTGFMLYKLATGQHAFEGKTQLAVLTRHVNEDCPDARKIVPGLSADFAKVLAGLTARKKEFRYQTPAIAQSDIERVLSGGRALGPRGSAAKAAPSGAASSPVIKPSPSPVIKPSAAIGGGSGDWVGDGPTIVSKASPIKPATVQQIMGFGSADVGSDEPTMIMRHKAAAAASQAAKVSRTKPHARKAVVKGAPAKPSAKARASDAQRKAARSSDAMRKASRSSDSMRRAGRSSGSIRAARIKESPAAAAGARVPSAWANNRASAKPAAKGAAKPAKGTTKARPAQTAKAARPAAKAPAKAPAKSAPRKPSGRVQVRPGSERRPRAAAAGGPVAMQVMGAAGARAEAEPPEETGGGGGLKWVVIALIIGAALAAYAVSGGAGATPPDGSGGDDGPGGGTETAGGGGTTGGGTTGGGGGDSGSGGTGTGGGATSGGTGSSGGTGVLWPRTGRNRWRQVWSLADAKQAPALIAPALWSEPGRIAAPMAWRDGIDDAALAAAFAGEAERTDPTGKVRVTYGDDVADLDVRPRVPGLFFLRADLLAGRARRAGGGVEIRAPAASGRAEVRVGDARWRNAGISFRVRARSDGADASISIANANRQPLLEALGNRERVFLRTSSPPDVSGSLALGATQWRRMALLPDAAPGQRVFLDDQPAPRIDAALDRTKRPDGEAWLTLEEGRYVLRDLSVEGFVLRPDVAATAVAPNKLSSSARIAVTFESDVQGSGGPFVALGQIDGNDADGDRVLRLEVDDRWLLLYDGREVIASHDLGEAVAASGKLELLRHRDRVLGRAELGGKQLELDAVLPLPLGANEVRAAWGSTAPTVTFSTVVVEETEADELTAAVERAASGGRDGAAILALAEAAASDDAETAARARWRLGATRLARAASVARADPMLIGLGSNVARRAAIAVARADLVAADEALAALASDDDDDEEEAKDRLQARLDAIARAVLASVLLGDDEGAEAHARRLVSTSSPARARSTLDHLESDGRRAVLVHRLARGYGVGVTDPGTTAAAARAAEVVAPDLEATALFHRGFGLLYETLADGEVDEAEKAKLEDAVRTLEHLRRLAADPVAALDLLARVYSALGRHKEAIERWDEAKKRGNLPDPRGTIYARAKSLAAIGRSAEALESALVAYSYDPAPGPIRDLVHETALGEIRSKDPAVAAAVFLTLGQIEGDATLRKMSRDAARRVQPANGPRSVDIARYVLIRFGERPPVAGGNVARPTVELVRAARAAAGGKTDQARKHLIKATRDELAAALARLDPKLAPLLP